MVWSNRESKNEINTKIKKTLQKMSLRVPQGAASERREKFTVQKGRFSKERNIETGPLSRLRD